MPRRKKTEEQPAPPEATVNAAVVDEPVDTASLAEDEPTGGWRAPEIERMVMFKLGSREFGLPIDDVQEIQQIVALTEFPDTSPALVGMVNLRGDVVPVIDLRVLLGMERRPYTLETPMIVCRRDDRLVALIVDEVEDVIELPEGCMQEPSRLYELADKLLGVCRMDSDLVFLLDLAALIPAADLATFARLEERASS